MELQQAPERPQPLWQTFRVIKSVDANDMHARDRSSVQPLDPLLGLAAVCHGSKNVDIDADGEDRHGGGSGPLPSPYSPISLRLQS